MEKCIGACATVRHRGVVRVGIGSLHGGPKG